MSKSTSEDIRPKQAIPAEGQETHEGMSGFIPEDKSSNQGSKPYDGNLNWPTRSGIQNSKS
jgi:hypothetical protein